MSKQAVLDILEKAADDVRIIADLTEHGSEALEGYDLSWQEAAAILSGDIPWIEKHLGRPLTARERIWLDCRLQQERW